MPKKVQPQARLRATRAETRPWERHQPNRSLRPAATHDSRSACGRRLPSNAVVALSGFTPDPAVHRDFAWRRAGLGPPERSRDDTRIDQLEAVEERGDLLDGAQVVVAPSFLAVSTALAFSGVVML